jgi:hypothetical protein
MIDAASISRLTCVNCSSAKSSMTFMCRMRTHELRSRAACATR